MTKQAIAQDTSPLATGIRTATAVTPAPGLGPRRQGGSYYDSGLQNTYTVREVNIGEDGKWHLVVYVTDRGNQIITTPWRPHEDRVVRHPNGRFGAGYFGVSARELMLHADADGRHYTLTTAGLALVTVLIALATLPHPGLQACGLLAVLPFLFLPRSVLRAVQAHQVASALELNPDAELDLHAARHIRRRLTAAASAVQHYIATH